MKLALALLAFAFACTTQPKPRWPKVSIRRSVRPLEMQWCVYSREKNKKALETKMEGSEAGKEVYCEPTWNLCAFRRLEFIRAEPKRNLKILTHCDPVYLLTLTLEPKRGRAE